MDLHLREEEKGLTFLNYQHHFLLLQTSPHLIQLLQENSFLEERVRKMKEKD